MAWTALPLTRDWGAGCRAAPLLGFDSCFPIVQMRLHSVATVEIGNGPATPALLGRPESWPTALPVLGEQLMAYRADC